MLFKPSPEPKKGEIKEKDKFTVFTKNQSIEPIFGFYIGLTPQCIDGQEFL